MIVIPAQPTTQACHDTADAELSVSWSAVAPPTTPRDRAARSALHSGGTGLLLVATAVLVFLAVESALLFGSARLCDESDER